MSRSPGICLATTTTWFDLSFDNKYAEVSPETPALRDCQFCESVAIQLHKTEQNVPDHNNVRHCVSVPSGLVVLSLQMSMVTILFEIVQIDVRGASVHGKF